MKKIFLLTIFFYNFLFACECNSRIAYGYTMINKTLIKEYSFLEKEIKTLDKNIKKTTELLKKENIHLGELILLEKKKLVDIKNIAFLTNKLNSLPETSVQNKTTILKNRYEYYRRNNQK